MRIGDKKMKFEIGDIVVNVITEELADVISIDGLAQQRCAILIKDHSLEFSIYRNGKTVENDVNPTWVHREGFKPATCTEPKRRPNLELDAPILVSKYNHQVDSGHWGKRHFKCWNPDGSLQCWNEGRTSFTERFYTDWKYWKLPEDEQ